MAAASRARQDDIKLVQEYLAKATWKGAENANSTYSHQGLMQYISGHIVSEYWLNHVYTEEIRRYSKEENRFHIHDLGFLSAYCSGWSIEDILLEGFGGVENKIQCRPPKHLNAALDQIVNFLFTLQGELAGAQALSNFDTYLAPFVRHDALSEEAVFKYVQSFVYSLNVPTRSGFQAPFTNISMDLVCPRTLEGQPVIIGGKRHSTWTYNDFQREMDIINCAFTGVMIQGDGNGNIFSFPIPTYNLYDGFDWDSPQYRDLNPEDFRSMCCRLRLDISKLHNRAGGLFGSIPLTGSIGVVTLNLPNLAIRCAGTKESFFEILADTLRVAKDSLEIKRKIIDGHAELYPYAAHYLSVIHKRTGSYWTNHFSTIGVLGMHEALIEFFGEGIMEQKDFALEVLEFIKQKLQEFQRQTGNLYNLEATPAESTSYRLAQRDQSIFPDHKVPKFYTNSTMLPVNATEDVFEALNHQEELQSSYTGGTVFHAFLGERLPSWKQARDLVKTLATRYRIPYLSLTPTFSICKAHGYIDGEQPKCPICAEECLVYSRIVGYFRPTKDWNEGKKTEFAMRKRYRVPAAIIGSSQSVSPVVADLPVAGYTKLTLSDYPGKVQASIMFTSRCNLQCPWCHNGPIVLGERDPITVFDILKHITSTEHKNLVISGGEPTIHTGLIPFLRILKASGVSVKLDSNGTAPDVLRQIVAEKLVDFIAMDIKCALHRYKQVAGRHVDVEVLRSSIDVIKSSGVPFEFRTTVVPSLVDIEDLVECNKLADGRLTIQRFRSGKSNLHKRFRNCEEYTEEELNSIVSQLAISGYTYGRYSAP
ncbi:anaerobic ribonucleoside triphosphate reductase [Xylogone sp. PMI_703]|nr:anaerobic ribonucleoside triphosphate reductase [Xylogone sp. PMI_703]